MFSDDGIPQVVTIGRLADRDSFCLGNRTWANNKIRNYKTTLPSTYFYEMFKEETNTHATLKLVYFKKEIIRVKNKTKVIDWYCPTEEALYVYPV